MIKTALLFLFLSLVLTRPANGEDFIWWEGESPVETNFPANSPFAPQTLGNRADLLSGSNWLSTGGKRGKDVLFARYSVTVSAPGLFHFWVRKFWAHGPFRWRFDQNPWQTCDRLAGLSDDVPLKKFVNADWVSLGTVSLSNGIHPFEVQLLANEGEETACGFDCFILSRAPFFPNGNLKPGERRDVSDPGYFPYQPSIDPFTNDANLDLRSLNETSAGEHGFLKRAGDHFTLGDGTPTRFWAVDLGPGNANQDRATVDYLARKLAKLGVNMVRFHGPLFSAADPTQLDPVQLDNLMYLVAALKKQGIYTYLSFYYPLWIDASAQSLKLNGYAGIKNKNPFALLYFDPQMQALYRNWARQLLDFKSPYTGLTLGADPALGIVEIVNEDSIFFWTFSKKNIPPEKWRELEDQYSRWLENKYGSVSKALASWSGPSLPDDSPAHAGLYEAYAMTPDSARRLGTDRIADQTQFLAQLQRDFYTATAKFFREELHVGGLVNCSNWYTADPSTAPIDRWTNLAGDMTDQHGYFSAKVTGEGSGYNVREENVFTSQASVQQPISVPLRCCRTADRPQIISELDWMNPNRYRADAVFLSAEYGSLQNVDGLFFFAVKSNVLADSSMEKFGICEPIFAGAFPAAALVYRRGDIQPGNVVLPESVDEKNMFNLPPATALAFAPFVGQAVRTFTTDVAPLPSWADHVHASAKRIDSITGELSWDFGNGVATANTPRAKGATGFLAKAGPVVLGNITIDCRNEFAAIWVVSLDGLPIRQSKRILLQATTANQPYGFKTQPTAAGEKMTDIGRMPMEMQQVAATVTFHQMPGPWTLTVLDENGYQKRRSPLETAGPDLQITLPKDAIQQVLTR